MADRRFDLEDLVVRPGTYFNPQTEVMVVVDDSMSLDNEIFNLEEFEGADWVQISDEVPIDEDRRDREFEAFQSTYHGGDGRHVGEGAVEDPDTPANVVDVNDEVDAEEPAG